MSEPTPVDTSDFDITSSNLTPDQVKDALDVEEPAKEVADADAFPETPATEPAKVDKRTRDGKAKSIQAEIDAATARRESAKREADAEESRLATMRRERQQLETPTPRQETRATADTDPEPLLDTYANEADPYTSWARAVARWEARQEWKTQETQRQQRDQQQAIQEQAEAAATQTVERIRASVGDEAKFLTERVAPELLAFLPSTALQPGQRASGQTAIADSILASAIPDKLLLHLTEHPDELRRIASLAPSHALREVGILEGSLRGAVASHGPTARPPVASAAPPPTKPLGGSPSVSRDSDDDDEDLSEAAVNRRIEASRKALRR